MKKQQQQDVPGMRVRECQFRLKLGPYVFARNDFRTLSKSQIVYFDFTSLSDKAIDRDTLDP